MNRQMFIESINKLAIKLLEKKYSNMNAQKAYEWAKQHGERVFHLESSILECPYISFCYSRDIIKGRWIEAEDIISNYPECLFWYVSYVIKDKLPDDLHNKMLAYKLADNAWAIDYFNFLKKRNVNV